MNAVKKQLRFFFSIVSFCGMITGKINLSSETCFAMEQDPPFSYYEVIEQRNIFRPKTEAAVPTQGEEPRAQPLPEHVASGLDQYVLTGIVKIRGKYKATITDKGTKTGHYVDVDDFIDLFKIIDIQQGRVIFERNGETFELKINTPATHILYKNPGEDEDSPAGAAPAEKPPVADNQINRRTNIMKSIRMGIPNAQRN